MSNVGHLKGVLIFSTLILFIVVQLSFNIIKHEVSEVILNKYKSIMNFEHAKIFFIIS